MTGTISAPVARPTVSPDAMLTADHIQEVLDKTPDTLHDFLARRFQRVAGENEVWRHEHPTFTRVVCADFARSAFRIANDPGTMETQQDVLRKLACHAMVIYGKTPGGRFVHPEVVEEFERHLGQALTAA